LSSLCPNFYHPSSWPLLSSHTDFFPLPPGCMCAQADLAWKRKEILKCVPKWTNLENIMLSEISHSHEGKYGVIPFIFGTHNG
jgi:hypothetical protein